MTLSVDSLPVHRKSIPEPDWVSPKSRNSLIIVPEPPPPVPPHKTPISVHPSFEPPTSRPRSNLTSGRKCASREDLTDRVTSNAVAKSDRSLHRSVGSELPKLADHYCQWQQQPQQQPTSASVSTKQPTLTKSVKSPSSSESSRKRRGVTNLSSANHRDPWAATALAYPPSSSNRKEDLSSPGKTGQWPEWLSIGLRI